MLLIIEDSPKHQMAAKAQLPEATVVNYDEAYRILEKARPGEIAGIITDLHFKIEIDRTIPSAPFASYENNYKAIGTQMPLGLAFVLKGVELQTPVVLYSDLDHHSDLMTGLLDMFGRNGYYRCSGGLKKDPIPDPMFTLNCDCSCSMAEDMHWDGEKIIHEPRPEAPSHNEDEGVWKAHREKRVKDWRIALQSLNRLTGK